MTWRMKQTKGATFQTSVMERSRTMRRLSFASLLAVLGICLLFDSALASAGELPASSRPRMGASRLASLTVIDALTEIPGEVIESPPPPPAEIIEYYAVDAIGSTRVVVAPDGTVLGRGDYLPFGELLSGANLPPEQFTGQQRDVEAGLDYFNARYYGSRLGRFATADPASVGAQLDPQEWNRYAYARNSPLSRRDPTGMWDEVGGDGGSLVYDVTVHGIWDPGDVTLPGNAFPGWAAFFHNFDTCGARFCPEKPELTDPGTPKTQPHDGDGQQKTPPPGPNDNCKPLCTDKDGNLVDKNGKKIELTIAGVPRLSPFAAAALIAEIMGMVGANPELRAELEEFAEGQYPNLVDKAEQLHHIIPQYLGGPREYLTNLVIQLPAAYHRMITTAFQAEYAYGQEGFPTSERLREIIVNVYSKFPIW